MQTLYLKLLA